jgi:hypothetical protein
MYRYVYSAEDNSNSNIRITADLDQFKYLAKMYDKLSIIFDYSKCKSSTPIQVDSFEKDEKDQATFSTDISHAENLGYSVNVENDVAEIYIPKGTYFTLGAPSSEGSFSVYIKPAISEEIPWNSIKALDMTLTPLGEKVVEFVKAYNRVPNIIQINAAINQLKKTEELFGVKIF